MKTEELYYQVGEVARNCGVSTDTIRHYERKGVLPKSARGENNYRSYPPSVVGRVLLVRRALALGFTLDEMAQILAERDRGGAPCQAVKALAEKKIEVLEVRLQELTALRDELRGIVATWGHTLTNTEAGKPARLLETLAKERSS